MNSDLSLKPAALADQMMAVEVFSELLASTDPRQLGQKLTEQLRELTGARTVLLIEHPEGTATHELVHACPPRRATLFAADELGQFCPNCNPEALPRRAGDFPRAHPLRPLLLRAGIESLLRFPLRVGGELVAVLLLLDLPGMNRIDETARIVAHLSPVMALALKNSIVHERLQKQARQLQLQTHELERHVAQRTAELEAANQSLVTSRLAALNLMEDAVAARQRAEEAAVALRESEDKFKGFFEHSNVGKSITLLSGEMQTNQAFGDLLGYAPAEFRQRQWQVITHPDDVEPTRQMVATLLSGKQAAARLTQRYLHKNGSVVWVDVSTTLRRNAAGEPLYLMTTAIDITERKRAEEALRESEAHYRSLFENMLNGFAYCRMLYAQGKPRDFVYLAVNGAFEKLTGLKDVEGKKVSEAIPGIQEKDPGLFEIYGRVARTGEPESFETYVEALKMWFEIAVYSPRPDHFVAVFDVINQRKLAEAELHRLHEELQRHAAELEQRVRDRTAQLEATNQELEAFSYSVSHDLRAPLRAINGYARILAEDQGPKLDAVGQRVLEVIRAEALRMGQLIDDLLQFSRLGRQPLRIAATDMTALAREVYDNLSVPVSGRKVDFHLTALPAVLADAALLRQVWVNLLNNALKYTRQREHAIIEVRGTVQGKEAIYCVKDNGAGFDMKYASKLFGVFQRLHRADEFEGTGVGLALVQRLLHRHGGRIWAEAEPDRGATFCFSLPVEEGRIKNEK